MGRSEKLECPDQESEESEGGTEITYDESPACIEYLADEWGDRLDFFNVSNAARDLGYILENNVGQDEEVFVYGASYGSTWAHRYMQIFPEQADGVILDSLAINFDGSAWNENFHLTSIDFMQYCADDPFCSGKLGGDPWVALGDLLDDLDAGHCSELGMDRDTFRPVLAELLMSWDLREFIPPVIYRVARCDPDDVAAFENMVNQLFNSAAEGDGDEDWSQVVNTHIWFSELWPDEEPTAQEIQDIIDASYVTTGDSQTAVAWIAQYESWPRYDHDEYWNQWTESQLPTLMMNGDLDPQTPIWIALPAQAEIDGDYQYFFTFPRAPHGAIMQTPQTDVGLSVHCGMKMMLEFLDDPTVEPDSACLETIDQIGFENNSFYANWLFGQNDPWENSATKADHAAVPRPPGIEEWVRQVRRSPFAGEMLDVLKTLRARWESRDAREKERKR